MSRDCQVSRNTAEGYLEILEDLLLGFRLDVFTKRANRPSGPLDSPTEMDGAALDGLAAPHLRALRNFGKDYPPIRRYLLYRGKDRLKRDDVLCPPCEEFPLGIEPGRFPS